MNNEGAYVMAGGGTGGHLFPALAVAREIRRRRPDARILFVGSARGLEATVVPREGFALETIRVSGIVGKRPAARLAGLLRLPVALAEAWSILKRARARVAVGVGGYASGPVILSAAARGIPTLVHEQNSMPGITNRILNRIATQTAVGFAAANRYFRRPGIDTGNPVRPEFWEVAALESRPISRRLLVFGGSQGARVLNAAVLEAASALEAAGIAIVLQTGEKPFEEVRDRLRAASSGVRVVPFLPRLWEEMAPADLVVARAGALTLAELAAAGRPAILVPFAAATHGHQMENARTFAEAGAVRVVAEEELFGGRLAAEVRTLLDDPEKLSAMARAARALARPDAASRIVDLIFALEGAA
jgi:UDP-N-acetylglucosamine--N-acetylmuramyl-(pentapeptide) pyrophosphoryl-undecaprenol N-acetylglucosamine transferase